MVMSEKYPFLTVEMVSYHETATKKKYKTEKGFTSFLQRENDKIKEKVWAPKVEDVTIVLNWKKDGYGSMQSKADVLWKTEDGLYHRVNNMERSRGNGIDKGMYVIVSCLNKILFGTMARKVLSGEVISEKYPLITMVNYSKMLADYGIKEEHIGGGERWDRYNFKIE